MENLALQRHFNIRSTPHSLRSSSPINTEFYRSNPCERSSSPTTLLQPVRKDNSSPVPSEDSISLTEEENIKLDQLIESAMPKVFFILLFEPILKKFNAFFKRKRNF